MQAIGFHLLRRIAGHDHDFLRIRAEDADDEIIAHPMWTENAERIGMRAGQEGAQFVDGQPEEFEVTHAEGELI